YQLGVPSGRKYTRLRARLATGVKQAFILGYLPTTMQPTALWSISSPWERAMVGVSVVRISPTQIERPVIRVLLHPAPPYTEPPGRSRAARLPKNGRAHLSVPSTTCQ